MRILFWGTPGFAVPALCALDEEGHELVGVVTQPDRPAGRGRGVSRNAVKEAAMSIRIPILQPERARGEEFMAQVRTLKPDLSVVVAFGQILKPEVLALPPLGSINIHASLLPELRGAAPIHWAIARGHQVTGVSIMQMEAGLDSGPVLMRVEEPILSDETTSELTGRLAEVGAEALVETLALLDEGTIVAEPQDHSRATFAPKVDRETARIDWTREAQAVALHMRAMDELPGAWSQLGTSAIKLFRPAVTEQSGVPGTVLAADRDGIVVACGTGAVRIQEVQAPGKRRMGADEWFRGSRISPGERFGSED
jgi:methionyl-tRNA formyltransferase